MHTLEAFESNDCAIMDISEDERLRRLSCEGTQKNIDYHNSAAFSNKDGHP